MRFVLIDLNDPDMAEPIWRFLNDPEEFEAFKNYEIDHNASMAEYVRDQRYSAFCKWYRDNWES